MFTAMSSRVPSINHISRSKVKVTLRCHRKTLVRSKTSTYIKGFQYNLAQMLTIVRRSVECKIKVSPAKVKVTHRGQCSDKKSLEMIIYKDLFQILPIPYLSVESFCDGRTLRQRCPCAQ
jgi:hypothetical protein